MSRIDDIINVAGHRLSTGSIEQIVSAHPAVAECAVIGADDPVKGMAPLGFLVLKADPRTASDVICAEVIALVRDQLGPVAAFKAAHVVDALPKTRSGKILRGFLRSLANGDPLPVPATIEDPSVADRLRQQFLRGQPE